MRVMEEQTAKISNRTAFLLAVTITLRSMEYFLPQYMADSAKQAFWLSPLFMFALLILVFPAYSIILKTFAGMNPVDIMRKVFGRVAGALVGAVAFIWMVILSAFLVRYFVEGLSIKFYTYVDTELLLIFILLVIGFVLHFKTVYVSRINDIFVFIFLFLSALSFILLLTRMDVKNLAPVSSHNVPSMITSGIGGLGIVAIGLNIFFLTDRIAYKKNFLFSGVGLSGFILVAGIVLLLSTVGVFGYSVVSKLTFPYTQSIKTIHFLGIDRVDALFVPILQFIDIITITMMFFIVLTFFKGLFKLEEVKPFIWLLVAFVGALGIALANNFFDLLASFREVFIYGNIFITLFLPLVIAIVAKLRKLA
ncbi:MAG: GerAB/ArcD/ProY family transporter [Bacillota bacterium]|nr:GerAB/ArcD/ProY family transporter [Bacillota bacterium]